MRYRSWAKLAGVCLAVLIGLTACSMWSASNPRAAHKVAGTVAGWIDSGSNLVGHQADQLRRKARR